MGLFDHWLDGWRKPPPPPPPRLPREGPGFPTLPGYPDDIRQDICERFETRARLLWDRGFRRHYGAQRIIEAMRFDDDLKYGPESDTFKINNNDAAVLARWYMVKYPDAYAVSFFETRKSNCVLIIDGEVIPESLFSGDPTDIKGNGKS